MYEQRKSNFYIKSSLMVSQGRSHISVETKTTWHGITKFCSLYLHAFFSFMIKLFLYTPTLNRTQRTVVDTQHFSWNPWQSMHSVLRIFRSFFSQYFTCNSLRCQNYELNLIKLTWCDFWICCGNQH